MLYDCMLDVVDAIEAGKAAAYSSSHTAQSKRSTSSVIVATSAVSFAISAFVAALNICPFSY